MLELGEDRHQRIPGGLMGEVIELATTEPQAGTATGCLRARGAEQQRVERGDRALTLAGTRLKLSDPVGAIGAAPAGSQGTRVVHHLNRVIVRALHRLARA